MAYTKEDLLWEATRRNENYKKLYFEIAGKETPINWERIWHPGSYNWKIDALLHPAITIEDINNKAESGIDRKEIHPYNYMIKPIVQHEQYHSIIENLLYKSSIIENDIDQYKNVFKKLLISLPSDKDRVLISFDLMENDIMITREIKALKKKLRLKLKSEVIKKSSGENNRMFNLTKINSYILWLKEYDRVVDYFMNTYKSNDLNISSGAIMLPVNCSYTDLVQDYPDGEKFEVHRKAVKDAHEGAIVLIQQTPNIRFSVPRIEKKGI